MASPFEKLPDKVFLKIVGHLDKATEVYDLARVNKDVYKRIVTRANVILRPFITREVYCTNLALVLRVAYACTIYRGDIAKVSKMEDPVAGDIDSFPVLACAAHLAEKAMDIAFQSAKKSVLEQGLCPFSGLPNVQVALWSGVAFNKTVCLQQCALSVHMARLWLQERQNIAGQGMKVTTWATFLADLYPDTAVLNRLGCVRWCSHAYAAGGHESQSWKPYPHGPPCLCMRVATGSHPLLHMITHAQE
ncbi:F-box-like domain-containing protein [Purpureocillium lavendulum]|uniref:F-box-like domain-containing protein n=1 Tax=Purpureocillium lavendulum TaxID=1247861 RepID=A0AB34G780_9HYPO|nr:F-box-like domain-containing protein [Purpureocillium lavendulum]